MRFRFFIFLIATCFIIVSCQRQEYKETDLSFIEAIYCTPYDISQCLPLEIVKTSDGWQAKYSGAPTNEPLLLKPRFAISEEGDSTIIFDEYLQGKINGRYEFEHAYGEFFDSYQIIKYTNSEKKDTTLFHATVIKKDFIFIDQRNFSESVEKITNHPLGGYGIGTEERDVNFKYLMHNNPETFTGSYKGFENLDVVDSPDKKLRIYRLSQYNGGNGIGCEYYILPVQYKTDYGIITLDDISLQIFNQFDLFSNSNFPVEYRFNILQASLFGKTYYMIDIDYIDPRPAAFPDNNDLIMTSAMTLSAFHIDKGRLKPAKIFNGESFIELVFQDRGDDMANAAFKYDEKKKELQVPIVNKTTHQLTGKYRTIKIG